VFAPIIFARADELGRFGTRGARVNDFSRAGVVDRRQMGAWAGPGLEERHREIRDQALAI
jgi:hypothetical protein